LLNRVSSILKSGNVDLGIIISGSSKGTCLVHDLYTGKFLINLNIPTSTPSSHENNSETTQKKIDTTSTTSTAVDSSIHLIRIIPNTSRVIVITSTQMITFSSSTGEMLASSMHLQDARPHSINVSPDSRFLVIGSSKMVTVVLAHNLEVIQMLCRVMASSKLSELRQADALRTRSVDGAEVLPDGTILIEADITTSTLSLNGDVAIVGCENGQIHGFLVGLNRG
jgi:hypothetical protein